MRIEQLEQVVAIANTGSFHQAARILYISQPNLSASVKRLEEEIGNRIFDRDSGGVHLTHFGIGFVERAKLLLGQFDLVNLYCKDNNFNRRQMLRVATANISAIFPAFLEIIQKKCEDPYDFSFMTYMSLDEVIDEIKAFRADVAVVGMLDPFLKGSKMKFENNKIEYHFLTKVRICVVCGKKNPLFNHEGPITTEDLRPYILASFDERQADPSFSLSRFMGMNDKVKGNIYTNAFGVMHKIIEKTQAVGLIADFNNQIYHDRKKYKILQFNDPNFFAEVGWIKLKKMNQSEMMEAFIKNVNDCLK